MACTSRDLVKGEPIEPRRVIVVIGDGHDTSSKKTLEEVLELAQRNLVTIYADQHQGLRFQRRGREQPGPSGRGTGGRVETPLNSLYKGVSGYLSTPSDEGNYALKVGTGGYASRSRPGCSSPSPRHRRSHHAVHSALHAGNSDDREVFRNIEVKVALPNVRVRTR